jgi:hypothetical protein
VLLGFWKLREGRLQSELLPAFVELRDHILITRQLVDETVRNRLNVFMESAKFVEEPQPPAIPEHLMATEEAKSWNARHKTVMEGRKALDRDWQTVLIGLANAISAGQDPVSRALEPLLATARGHEDAHLNRARDRKERGNPPGKKGDPLGDQLSWEQFLDAVRGEKSVWIVTRDRDYATRISAAKVRIRSMCVHHTHHVLVAGRINQDAASVVLIGMSGNHTRIDLAIGAGAASELCGSANRQYQ